MPFLCLLAMLLFSLPAAAQITLTPRGVFPAGGVAAAEIPAYDRVTKRIFSVNGSAARVDVIDISNPALPSLYSSIPVSGQPNSVDVCDGVVAVAVQASPKTDPGKIEFFDANGTPLGQVAAGALPDMVTFTPNCRYVLVANEGEAGSYGQPDSVDPEGSVSVIDLKRGISRAVVRTARFHDWILKLERNSIRHFGPGATFAQDMEPEYIAVSEDSRFAWITVQEANAIATLDIEKGVILTITGLGFKDHNQPGNGLDPSDADGGIHIGNWRVRGMYQPDAIAFFKIGLIPFLVVANEGDARDGEASPGFVEDFRVGSSSAKLDPTAFPNAGDLKMNSQLGRLTVSKTGDVDNDGDLDHIMSFGARSFSIRNVLGGLVWDSGDELEQKTALLAPGLFNSEEGDAGEFDRRSDNKGPEPEGVVVGKVGGRTYAFIGLERIGGIMVYDVTLPWSPKFVHYATSSGDLSPEGLVFISAEDSPNQKPLLVVSHEVSGTVRIFEINKN
jgi:hypothetical protein